MTPSASKPFQEASRLRILALNIRATYERETAYVAENWGSLASTFLYTATYLLLFNVIYANVSQVAGYGRDQMLFLIFIGQINFYTMFNWGFDNLEQLIVDVNLGNLDMVLTKPLPSLFYICTREASVVGLLRDGIPPLALIALSIHWANIHVTAPHFLAGLAVFACGMIAFHTVMFFLTIPCFWLGESINIFNIVWSLDGYDIPLEGYPKALRVILSTAFPVIISVSGTASVMLGMSPVRPILLGAVAVAAVCILLRTWAWKRALRAYTSASS